MSDKELLENANAKLKQTGISLVIIRAGTHPDDQYCAELVTGPGYPDEECAPMGDAEPKLLDYEVGSDPKTVINLVLFRELCRDLKFR
jgi:hypothetical protein